MKLRHTVSIVLTGGMILAGLTSGCTKTADPVLATVGERQVTLATYRNAYQSMAGDKPDISTPGKRRDFLKDLINKELLEQEAYRLNPNLDEGIRRRLHRFAESQLIQVLTKKEITDKVTATDAEVMEIWNRMDREIKASHILGRTEAEMQDIQAALKSGKSFEDVAKEKSYDTKTGELGGDLGWVTAGQMVEPFDHALFKMKKGEISEPVKSKFGWHVIRMDDERPAVKPPIDQVKEKIRINLLQQRSGIATESFNKALSDKAQPENQEATLELIDRKFVFEIPPEKANDPYYVFSTNRTLPTFSAEELAMPVVKFADRPALTVKDFSEALDWIPSGMWPRGNGTEEVEDLIRQILRTKLYKEKAVELGLDKSAEYVATVKKKENEMRVNNLYYNQIVNTTEPSDTDLHNFFEQNRQNYKLMERSIQARIEASDSSAAARVAAFWRSGHSLDEAQALLQKLDSNSGTIPRSRELPRGGEPPLDTLLYAAGPDVVVGPVFLTGMKDGNGVPLPNRWVVAKALEIRPERIMSYDEAGEYVKEHAKARATEEKLKAFLAELEKRFPVQVNEKALEALTPESVTAAVRTTT